MLLDKITPVDIHIASKLRELRLVSGLSQEKLGELVGVTFQQIQKYEKAKNRICASRLFEFSQILERPMDAFFEGLKADLSIKSCYRWFVLLTASKIPNQKNTS